VLTQTHDDDPNVRLQVALTLGESSDPSALNGLAELASRHGEERWMAAAILSSCRKTSDTLISRILQLGKPSAGARSVLKPLASSVGARRERAAVGGLLTTIAAWDNDSSIDVQISLLDGLIDGLERGKQASVDIGDAESALRRLLTTSAAELRPRALRVASLLQLDQAPIMHDLWSAAQKTALSETASLAQRAAAIEVLETSPWDYRNSLSNLIDVRQPLELQLAAVKALSAAEEAEATDLLLANWKSLSPRIQESIVDAFFSRLSRRPVLLDAIERGDVSAARLSSLRRMQLLDSSDAEIQRRAQSLIARPRSDERDAILEKFQSALSLDGNREQGQKVFEKQCSKCHRLEGKGFSVGAELTGATGRPNPTLLVDILDPSRNIDPDYTVYTVITNAGRVYTGVLAAETATSVTLRREEAAEDVILRMDIEDLTASSQSLMPDGMEKILSPQDLANLFVYLQEVLGQKKAVAHMLFDEQQEFANVLDRGSGKAEIVASDRYSGGLALRIEPLQRHSPRIANWSFSIAEKPAPGEFRYLRFAWKAEAASGIMLELADNGAWPPADMSLRRYYCGENTTPWQAKQIPLRAPKEWTVVTVDLWKDCGSFTLTGIAPTAMGGAALFDRIELLPSLDTAD
ncbi:MAG: c-type cytochrome, partial [Aeoliella sp.]